MSKVYHIKKVQVVPVGIEKAWNFFSDYRNLAIITPASLHFHIITSDNGKDMYPGQVIEYTLKPIPGIKMYWMTEITHFREHDFFVDEQRFGPYSLWHHQHHFKAVPGGVEMTDIVHYKIPFWFLGDIAHALFVKKMIHTIFDFRQKKIAELFGNR